MSLDKVSVVSGVEGRFVGGEFRGEFGGEFRQLGKESSLTRRGFRTY